MQNRLQTDANPAARPLWLRWLAVFCILLVGAVSTAQVSHSHALDRFLHNKQGIPDSGSDHCPLCMAMHSALPATLQTAAAPVLQVHSVIRVEVGTRRSFLWQFQLASRPPPADDLRS